MGQSPSGKPGVSRMWSTLDIQASWSRSLWSGPSGSRWKPGPSKRTGTTNSSGTKPMRDGKSAGEDARVERGHVRPRRRPAVRAATKPASRAPSTFSWLSSRNRIRSGGSARSSATRSNTSRSGFSSPSSNDRKRWSKASKIGQREKFWSQWPRLVLLRQPTGTVARTSVDELVGAGVGADRPGRERGEERVGLDGQAPVVDHARRELVG